MSLDPLGSIPAGNALREFLNLRLTGNVRVTFERRFRAAWPSEPYSEALHLGSNFLALPYILRKSASWMAWPIDGLTGRRFGKWTVLPRDDIVSDDRRQQLLVQCECGRLRLVLARHLLSGRSQSCGCTPTRKHSDAESADAGNGELRSRLQRALKGVRLQT
jgi:hypothetical protein